MHNMEKETVVVALGGSIVMPKDIDTVFLAKLQKMIVPLLKKRRVILVIGGGAIARDYQEAAAKLSRITNEDKDWIGIHCTRLNAHLLRTIFAKEAYPVLLDNPHRPISKSDLDTYSLFIASGWRPGWSTDYIACVLARRFSSKNVIIATKIPYVYDADISAHPQAKPLRELTWKQYRKMVGDKWIPGMKAPVDPIAARFAEEKKMEALILRGTEIENLRKAIVGENFRGTIIH